MQRVTPRGWQSLTLPQPCCLYSRVLTWPCAGFFCPVPANKHSFLVSEESYQWPKEQWIWFIPRTSGFQKKKYVLSRYQLGFVVSLLEAMDKSERKIEKTKKRVGYMLEKIELLVEKNWMVLMGRGEGRKRQEPGLERIKWDHACKMFSIIFGT